MATSATETAKQENGSRVFLESMIEKNREPSNLEMLKVYDGIIWSGKRLIKSKLRL